MLTLLLACAPRQASQQVAHAATMAQMRFHCDGDTVLINQLLMKGYESGLSDANGAEKIGEIAPSVPGIEDPHNKSLRVEKHSRTLLAPDNIRCDLHKSGIRNAQISATSSRLPPTCPMSIT